MKRSKGSDPAEEAFNLGVMQLRAHPLVGPLIWRARVVRREPSILAADGWAVVDGQGEIHVHPKRRAEPAEWAYVLAHCLLHLGLGHFKEGGRLREPRAWNAACDVAVHSLLKSLKVGRPPLELLGPREPSSRSEEALYAQFVKHGIPEDVAGLSTAGPGRPDMVPKRSETPRRRPIGFYFPAPDDDDFERVFGNALADTVAAAIDVAGGRRERLDAYGGPTREGTRLSASELAKRWFIGNYPLLGALAAGFKVVESAEVCLREQITVAAVSGQMREVYINPAMQMDEQEMRFVMAHELLHVGLRHEARRMGRDAYLWNVACDYVINGWLIEMGVGAIPRFGLLYAPQLKGLSAETIYDRLTQDLRRARKLVTLRGHGLGDILEGSRDWWEHGEGVAMDEFVRRAMAQGLTAHQQAGRGLIPAGLEEEIQALSQPPVPWDVELARWFDAHFLPLEKRRTFARPNRRQSGSPETPRPRWTYPDGIWEGRTFGVVLDTSGSMDRALLAKALGAVAGYALSREVQAVRVVFCDAAAYDEGYLSPDAIAGRVRVRGRGGTVLQPGVDLLERAEDFPKEGPVLVITDGFCDRVRVRREHAFLVPAGAKLPFSPVGPVFRIA